MVSKIRNAPNANELSLFLDAYAKYVVEILQPTQLEIQTLLEAWQLPDYWSKYKNTSSVPIPTPLRSTLSRIKRPEQVVDKIFRKPANFPCGLRPESFRTMYDAIGVRVVVYFLSHLPLIDRELRSSHLVEIVDVDPPMAYLPADSLRTLGLEHVEHEMKQSGYRSVHYNLRLRESALPEEDRPVFELQVRTAAMDLWSALEHHLGYKPGRRTHSSAKRQLYILSNMLGAIDENFNFLYEELNRFNQERGWNTDDVLTPEILPGVLEEVGVSCAQRDINNIIKFLFSRGVERVRDVFELATPRRIEIIRNTYLSSLGRLPVSLELIATLAALRGAEREREEIRRIKLQLAYRGAWDDIKQEFTGKADES
jgi:putative GTP pyrophosphokinase